MLTSTIFKSQIAAGISALVAFYLLSILPTLGGVWGKATPFALMGRASDLIVGEVENTSIAIWPNVALIVILMLVAWQIFEHEEL